MRRMKLKLLKRSVILSVLSSLLTITSITMLSMVWASSVAAVPLETAYTLNSSVDIDYGSDASVDVTLNPIAAPPPLLDAKNSSSICLAGTCDIQSQDWIVFTATVLQNDLDQLKVNLLDSVAGSLTALGMGYLLDGGPVQDGSGATASYTGTLADVDLPQFDFRANGEPFAGGAGITGTTLTLFVAYADSTLPQLPQPPFNIFGPGAAQFMLQPSGSAGIGSNNGNFATPISVIPEPGTALLMGMGIALLSLRRRQR